MCSHTRSVWPLSQVDMQITSLLSDRPNDHRMIDAIGGGETMARSTRETSPEQPLHTGEAAGTIAIDVAAKLLMVTPEWLRRWWKP